MPDGPFPHINDSGTFREVVRWLATAEITPGSVVTYLILTPRRKPLR